ncbi:MAG: ABC transporter substrate-binding protein [Chloroflexi bacterium]|nr:ABC transporter substrate-binding protein [Chloroflexota bacterium]
MAQTGIPASLSPEASSSNIPFFSALFDPLVTFRKGFTVVPQLAQRWEYRDGAWYFTLRTDVSFTNGQPLSVEDVVFTLNLIAEKNLPQRSYLPNLSGARAVDATTVEVTSRVPDVTILNGMAWAFILPKAYYEQVGQREFQTRAIGSGPYEVVEFRPSELAVFRKKPTHPFRTVTATELRFQTVPDNAAVISGLRTGEIDVTSHVTFSVDQVETLLRDGVGIEYLDGAYVFALASQPENRERNTPLTLKAVREALNYAVDKETIARQLYRQYGKPTGQLTITSSRLWLSDVPPWPYDPARAKQLLAQAGYPTGFSLNGIDFTPTSVNPQLVLALQGYLKEVGVEAEVRSYEIAVFLDKFYGRAGQSKSDLFVFISGDANGMGSVLRGNFACDKRGYEVWWCNQEFTRLFDQALAEPDDSRRVELQQRAHRALLADVPGIFLLTTPLFVAHGAKIANVELTTPLVYRFDTVYRVQ